LLQTRIPEDLAAGHDLVSNAAEAERDLHMGGARILAREAPAFGQNLEVLIAHDQVVGDAKDGGAQATIATAHQVAVLVDFIALIA